jgi:hypothetical protein
VCTFSFAFGEYVAGLFVSCHFFLPWRSFDDSAYFSEIVP